MKKYFIYFIVFFISCTGSKNGIEETRIAEFEEKNVISDSNTESSDISDSLALKILETDDSQEISNTTQKPIHREIIQQKAEVSSSNLDTQMEIPHFTFKTIPSDYYDISSGRDLKIIIIGKGNADITLTWQDNSGNWKTVKKGSKKSDLYSISYSPEMVKDLMGSGSKKIIAKIFYNEGSNPITENVILEIVETSKVQKNITKKDSEFKNSQNLSLTSNIVFDDIYFDSGEWKIPSFEFNTNYIITLGKIIKALKTDDDVTIILTGYTDNTGSKILNSDISEKRCISVGNLLLNLVKPSEKIKISSRIIIKGWGGESLLVESGNSLLNALNRRVAISYGYDVSGITLAEKLNYNPVQKVSKIHSDNIATIYKKALNKYYLKNYSLSSELFNRIINENPKHKLADNAKWWTGEILFHQGRYKEALQKYNEVFGLGDGNKEAYAQYRIGCCYRNMNMFEKAVEEFENVYNLYPKSTEEWGKAQKIIFELKN